MEKNFLAMDLIPKLIFDLEFEAEAALHRAVPEERIFEFYLPSQRKDLQKVQMKVEKHAMKMIKEAKILRKKNKNQNERMQRFKTRIEKSNAKRNILKVPEKVPAKLDTIKSIWASHRISNFFKERSKLIKCVHTSQREIRFVDLIKLCVTVRTNVM